VINSPLIFVCKSSWEFSKKEECNSLLKNWQMTFQALDYKGKNFLDLNDDDNLPTRPTYSKGGAWLKYFGHSNMLCAYTICCVHTLSEPSQIMPQLANIISGFTCLCGEYPIKTRNRILYSCRHYRKYRNPKRDSLKDITAFLEFNPGVFSFHEGIT